MRRPRDESGAVLIEFALVFPVFVMLTLGIFQYGYLFWAKSQAAAVAREVTRLAIVNTAWSCGETWGVRQARLPAVGSTEPTVRRTFRDRAGPNVYGVVPEGTRFTVTVSFRSFDLGLFPMPSGGIVSESAEGRVEYAPSLNSGGVSPQACPAEYQ